MSTARSFFIAKYFAAVLFGGLLMVSCRVETELDVELARFRALNSEGEVVGSSVLLGSRIDPAMLGERTDIRDQDGRLAITLTSRIERDPLTRYWARSSLASLFDEVELNQAAGSWQWRKLRGLAITRTSTPLDGPFLLAWAVAVEDGPSGSVALWQEMAEQLPNLEPSERPFSAFNTRRGRNFELYISHRESRQVTVDGDPRQAERFFISTRASGHTLWVDLTRGELLSVSDVLGTTMVREGFEVPDRELEPLPDSLSAEAVHITREDVELAGTLTLPRVIEGPYPAVILIHGSGPMDRDESPFMVFRHLAHDLGEAGFAVLRYDKRGVSESRFLSTEKDVTLTALAGDTRAWLDVLEQREDIDANRIFLAGHSEGGYIGPLVASQDSRVRGVVMLAGPVAPLLEVVQEQALLVGQAHQLTEREIDEMVMGQAALLRRVRSSMEPSESEAQAIHWLRSHDLHDSRQVLQSIRVPLLAIFATGDIQVPLTQADELADLASQREPGLIRIERLDGLDHVLMDDHGGRSGVGLLMDPDRRLDSRVQRLMVDWMETL